MAPMDDIPLNKNKRRQPKAPLPIVFRWTSDINQMCHFHPCFIPNELVAVILSFLTVKTITRFRCVNKSWNSVISDPTFIKMHFKKSSQNPHIILTPLPNYHMGSVVSLPLHRLLKNPSNIVSVDTYHSLKHGNYQVVGSCNGLLCLLFKSFSWARIKYMFYFWNPATRTISEELGVFREMPKSGLFKFTFGCDYLSGTYKVVALNEGSRISMVRVYSLGNNCWRNIESFPLVPLRCNYGVHLSGTVNWLAIRGDFVFQGNREMLQFSTSPVQQFLIVSLDLSTETYKQFLLPPSFDKVPCVEPSLRVMMDCLIFSHDFKGTEFVVWQMKEFRVQESWTQLLRIEYVYLRMHNNLSLYDNLELHGCMRCDTPLFPLYISKNGDTLILKSDKDDDVVIYNRRDKKMAN